MRSRLLWIMPMLICLCAAALPTGAGAQPVPAVTAPPFDSKATNALDAPAPMRFELAALQTSGALCPLPSVCAVRALNALVYEAFGPYAPIFTADARLPTVPGVTVGGGSSG